MTVDALRRTASRHGARAAASLLVFRLVNRVVLAKVFCCLESPTGAGASRAAGLGKYRCSVAAQRELFEASVDSSLELPSAFVEQALAAGHECAGVFEGGRLVSYCWFSPSETEIVQGIVACPPPGGVYAYKAFTAPSHRGEGLLGFCLDAGRERAYRAGRRKLYTVIESTNVASIKAFTRAGFHTLGRAWVAGLGRSRWTWNDASCRRAGFVVLASGACPRRVSGTGS